MLRVCVRAEKCVSKWCAKWQHDRKTRKLTEIKEKEIEAKIGRVLRVDFHYVLMAAKG